MNKHLKLFQITLFLLLALFFVGIPKGNAANNQETPSAKKGIVTISAQNIENGVPLNGQWEFYWKELLSPQDFKTNTNLNPLYFQQPSTWNNYQITGKQAGGEGFATYRLLIETDKVDELLALEIPAFYNNYKMWVNGVFLLKMEKLE